MWVLLSEGGRDRRGEEKGSNWLREVWEVGKGKKCLRTRTQAYMEKWAVWGDSKGRESWVGRWE